MDGRLGDYNDPGSRDLLDKCLELGGNSPHRGRLDVGETPRLDGSFSKYVSSSLYAVECCLDSFNTAHRTEAICVTLIADALVTSQNRWWSRPSTTVYKRLFEQINHEVQDPDELGFIMKGVFALLRSIEDQIRSSIAPEARKNLERKNRADCCRHWIAILTETYRLKDPSRLERSGRITPLW